MKEVFIDVARCLGCRSCALACAVAHSQSGELLRAIAEDPPPRARVFVEAVEGRAVPLNCRHCEEAQCAAVCPTGAMSRDPETRAVRHEPQRCLGCGFCELACPFGVITRLPGTRTVAKCDLCPGREVPACVEACPTGALLYLAPQDAQKIKRQRLIAQFFYPRAHVG